MTQPKPKSARELRRFGLVMTLPLIVIGGLMLWRGRVAAPYVLGLAGLFLGTGLLVPTALAPVERAWMALAEVLGAIMTRVILCLTFFLVITPFGLLMRFLGKELLHRKFDPKLKSYWVPVDPNGPCSRPDRPY